MHVCDLVDTHVLGLSGFKKVVEAVFLTWALVVDFLYVRLLIMPGQVTKKTRSYDRGRKEARGLYKVGIGIETCKEELGWSADLSNLKQ